MKKKNRREFIRYTSGMVGAGILGSSFVSEFTPEESKPAAREEDIICRTLGRTGIRIPIVSMGVMNSNNPNLLKEALKSGIRHLDTAWYYQGGNNELMIGRVLKELQMPREQVIIATKIPPGQGGNPPQGSAAKEQFLQKFHQSLERLQTDYVDILYYHGVSKVEQINDPWIREAFSELKEQGKIRFTGYSTHIYWPDLINDTAKNGFYDVILLSLNYSMSHDQRSIDAMKLAASKGIGLIAMKTQCQQAWYKEGLPPELQKFYEGKAIHSALLKWVLRHEYITTAVPGFTTFQQLKEDMSVAYNIAYTNEEAEFLKNQKIELALQSNCRLCGQCVPTCPQQADIPSLMRIHMYASAYGNTYMANHTLRDIPAGKGLDACENCSNCIARCAHKVPINTRINELKTCLC